MQITFDPDDKRDIARTAAILVSLGASFEDDGDSAENDGKVDSRGIPFLAEYHTGTTNKDGSWRLKKGVDRAAVDVAEKAARDANPIATPAAVAPTFATDGTAPLAPVVPAAVAQPAPVVPVVPAPAPTMPPVPAMPTPQTVTYEELVQIVDAAAKRNPAALAGPSWAALLVEVGSVDATGAPSNEPMMTNETVRQRLADRLRAI